MQALKIKCHPMSSRQRREIIRDNIFLTDYEGLGKLCGVTKRTIIRDINQWRQEGGFEECLMDEFVKTYPKIKQTFPDKAFDRLCYLIGKNITRKIEKKEQIEISEEIVTVNVTENEDEILSKAASILARKDRFNKIH